jgi:uncharacterized protein YlxW (UPF0749 family)
VSGAVDRLRAIPSWQVTLGLALLALGFLIAAQLAAEGPRIRYTTQERSPLVETVLELQRQQEALKARVLELRGQIQATSQATQGSAAQVRELNAGLERARLSAGLVPLTGTGLVLQLEDAADAGAEAEDGARVTAADIRTVVDEIWLAGAEAVAVNGERIAVSTAIVDIGGSVLVNQAYLAPPYQVAAIGPADLYERLNAARGYNDFLRLRLAGGGIRASYGEFDDVQVPAFAGSINLEHARPGPSEAP